MWHIADDVAGVVVDVAAVDAAAVAADDDESSPAALPGSTVLPQEQLELELQDSPCADATGNSPRTLISGACEAARASRVE